MRAALLSAAGPRSGLVTALLVVCGTPLSSPATAQAPASIKLVGVVRDFRKIHPDFATSAPPGHYAGNIALDLATDGRPVFAGGGFRVAQEWLDAASRPIAPHLFMTAGITEIPVAQPGSPPSLGVFDTWDSSLGPYGPPGNVGPAPTFNVGAPMPTIEVPSLLAALANQGDLSVAGTTTFSSDMHCDALSLSGTVHIDGHIRILCEEPLFLATHTTIDLLPGATLELYLMQGSSSWNHSSINANTQDPRLVTVYNLSTTEIMIHNHAEVYAQIISPDAPVHLVNHGDLYGTFVGLQMTFGVQGNFHLDTSAPTDACGVYVQDQAGNGALGAGAGITSAVTFDQWYRDVLGTNFSASHAIKLVDDGTGVYGYDDDFFWPIDGRLYGNEGDLHNNYFTFTLGFEFTYQACGGQFFRMEGADDAWLFVDAGLAIDLGGPEPGTAQYVELDRLRLADGETYRLNFFYAHRQAASPALHIRTNITPDPGFLAPAPTSSAPGD